MGSMFREACPDPDHHADKAEQSRHWKELVALNLKACMQQVPNDEQKLVKDVLDKLD